MVKVHQHALKIISYQPSAFLTKGMDRARCSTSDALSHIRKHYEVGQNNVFPVVDTTDGISIEFNDWRFNLRASNTEPLLRLNIEARGDLGLFQRKVSEIEKLIAIYR